MITKIIPRKGAFDAWRNAARELLAADVAPQDVQWSDNAVQSTLFDDAKMAPVSEQTKHAVPKDFIELARKVSAHTKPERFAWLYKVLWRLQREPHLMQNPADSDLHHLLAMAKSVSRDCHKMKAFVRFREVPQNKSRRRFVAWFEPEHHIVELTGPFFARRFADMDWLISTPQGIAMFADGMLSFAPPNGQRHALDDATEDLWRTYYSNIFNPARLKIKAMESEMPKKYWKNLPEAALIPGLIAGAGARTQKMREQMPSTPSPHLAKFKAPTMTCETGHGGEFQTLEALDVAARHCTRCPLHCHATQTVCGEGKTTARVMFVGEQPGDQEDIAGRPFVGPAGKIFDEALQVAGFDREDVYVTNAVKHFKFSTRGKRRIHERPNRTEIEHCRWWLDKELQLVKPALIVAMGATALFALTGENKAVSTSRGQLQWIGADVQLLSTYHPSAILRNDADAENIRRKFFQDITTVARAIEGLSNTMHIDQWRRQAAPNT
jgi:uracil-DNA glycosylase